MLSEEKIKKSEIDHNLRLRIRSKMTKIKSHCRFKICRSLAKPRNLKILMFLTLRMKELTAAQVAIIGKLMLIGNCLKMLDMQSTWQNQKTKTPNFGAN